MSVITFLSDYGHEDDFIGVCHGVMARICPEAHIIDITHALPRHQVRPAATVLRNALPYMPEDAVNLAIVDPDVGRERRAVALRTGEDRLLVGPDNGLLSLAATRLGGVAEAVEISRSQFRLEPVAATFHGRDVFAPVAAHLAAGRALAEMGDPLDPGEVVSVSLPEPRVEDDDLVAHALYVDRFGNVQLNVTHADMAGSGLQLGRSLEMEIGRERHPALYARTFADVPRGEILVYEDASRMLAVAVNRGHAADKLELPLDCELRLRPA